MPKANHSTTRAPLTSAESAPAGLARRSFLAGLAVTVPIAATASTAARAAPGADAELVALSKQLADLALQKEVLTDEMCRCEIAEGDMRPQYPTTLRWREGDPVPQTAGRAWWWESDIKALSGRTFRQWDFIGTREEYERLGMQDFEPHEIKPVLHYEHCFRAKPDEKKTARAKELMKALEDYKSGAAAAKAG
jgi:hypothetical protein